MKSYNWDCNEAGETTNSNTPSTRPIKLYLANQQQVLG